MADQLYLSYQVHGFTAQNMVRHFEKLLRLFPYSRLHRAGATLRVHAISTTEPPLVEELFEQVPEGLDRVIAAVREFTAPDCGAFLDTAWDVWQFDAGDWSLAPSRVTLACFGPGFENEPEENLRVDFGIDTHFLPQPGLPEYLFMARSNVRSLLHLVHELDRAFPSNVRRLWTESGENFAARLQAALEDTAELHGSV